MQKKITAGSWIYKKKSSELIWSDELYCLHERSIDQKITLEDSYHYFEGDDCDKFKEAFSRCIQSNTSSELNLKLNINNDFSKKIRLRISPIVVDGQADTIVGSLQDISDEVDISDSKIKSIFLSQLKSFGATYAHIAHEINNPLSIIVGHTARLKSKVVDESIILKSSESILKAVDRITEITRRLQRYAVDVQDKDLKRANVKRLVTESINSCRKQFLAKGINITSSDIPENIEIYCFEMKLSQILVSLLMNSKEAIESSENSEKWVNLQVNLSNGYLKISVIDSGTTPNSDQQEAFFRAFYSSKPDTESAGLGLSLVQMFTDDHRGKFYIDRNSKNTCFCVEIPIDLNNEA